MIDFDIILLLMLVKTIHVNHVSWSSLGIETLIIVVMRMWWTFCTIMNHVTLKQTRLCCHARTKKKEHKCWALVDQLAAKIQLNSTSMWKIHVIIHKYDWWSWFWPWISTASQTKLREDQKLSTLRLLVQHQEEASSRHYIERESRQHRKDKSHPQCYLYDKPSTQSAFKDAASW